MKKQKKSELLKLKYLGPAMQKELELLDITTIQQLAISHPDQLFQKYYDLTGKKLHPCVWDVFAATIHEAKTGEQVPWWFFSKIRKSRTVQK